MSQRIIHHEWFWQQNELGVVGSWILVWFAAVCSLCQSQYAQVITLLAILTRQFKMIIIKRCIIHALRFGSSDILWNVHPRDERLWNISASLLFSLFRLSLGPQWYDVDEGDSWRFSGGVSSNDAPCRAYFLSTLVFSTGGGSCPWSRPRLASLSISQATRRIIPVGWYSVVECIMWIVAV